MTTPRHASPEAPDAWGFRIPAHYLLPDTADHPLVLLMDREAMGPGVEGASDDLPIGVGLIPCGPASHPHPCQDCGSACWVWVMYEQEGPGEVECLLCLTMQAGTSYGVVPSSRVAWVEA